jgi:hypothetical protein
MPHPEGEAFRAGCVRLASSFARSHDIANANRATTMPSKYCNQGLRTHLQVTLGKGAPRMMASKSDAWTDARQGRVERFDLAAEEAALARVRALARIMDSAITIPGSGVTLGVDAILGLVPVAGDILSQVISSYIIWEARRLGVSHLTIGRMIANSLLDTVVGAIPVVGDAFDVAFRANLRNLALLVAELRKRGAGRPVIDI